VWVSLLRSLFICLTPFSLSSYATLWVPSHTIHTRTSLFVNNLTVELAVLLYYYLCLCSSVGFWHCCCVVLSFISVFVGFIINVYEIIIILCSYYICTMTGSISYRSRPKTECEMNEWEGNAPNQQKNTHCWFKKSSLPTLAGMLWYGILGMYQTHVPIARRRCHSHHQFYIYWRYELSEQWWHQRPLGLMYNILSLTNSTRLIADMTPLCTKNPIPNSWFLFPFPYENVYSSAGSVLSPSDLVSCTPTKSNLYLDTSFRLPHTNSLYSTFQICHSGRLFKEPVHVWGSCVFFKTSLFFTVKGC
jgi:hypothetical protein